MEKQAYAFVKAPKSSIEYVQSRRVAYVPHISVKDMLYQPDANGKRGNITLSSHVHGSWSCTF